MNPKKPFVVTTPLVIIFLVAIICVGVYLVYVLTLADQPIKSTLIDSTATSQPGSDWNGLVNIDDATAN